MKPRISVIVPVYRVEDYLPRCIDSILEQTYTNLDVILVDDGSDDACPRICDAYAKKDVRVRVIHQENKGLSAARNVGIESAVGELLFFVDSDDHMHNHTLEILWTQLMANGSSIAVCRHRRMFGLARAVDEPAGTVGTSVMSGLEAVESIYPTLESYRIMIMGKLFQKKIFDHNRFLPNVSCEDNYIIHHLYYAADKVVFIDTPLYYYTIRETSIMHRPYTMNRLDDIGAVEDRISFLTGKADKTLLSAVYIDYLEKLIMHFYFVKSAFPEKKDVRKMLLCKFRPAYRRSVKQLNLSAVKKLKYGIFSVSSMLYKLLNKMASLLRFHRWDMDFVIYPTITDGDSYG